MKHTSLNDIERIFAPDRANFPVKSPGGSVSVHPDNKLGQGSAPEFYEMGADIVAGNRYHSGSLNRCVTLGISA
jgi:hypothetical protein